MGLTLGDGAAGHVIVNDVAVGSMASQLGLMPGAVLVALNEVPIAGLRQKNEGDERRLLEELRAESMSKRMSHRGVRSDHQGVQALRLRSECALSAL